MGLDVAQEVSRPAEDEWCWSLWLVGLDENLDAVAFVDWELHPTFPNPIRRTHDRESGFRLEGRAWGEFMVHVRVHRGDGQVEELEHWLRLGTDAPMKPEGPTPEATFKRGNRPTVFMTAGLADSERVVRVKDALERKGYEVFSPEDLMSGSKLQSQIETMVEGADLGIALIGGPVSPWVQQEVRALKDQRTPVVPVMFGEGTELPQIFADSMAIFVSDDEDVSGMADRLVDAMPEGMKFRDR